MVEKTLFRIYRAEWQGDKLDVRLIKTARSPRRRNYYQIFRWTIRYEVHRLLKDDEIERGGVNYFFTCPERWHNKIPEKYQGLFLTDKDVPYFKYRMLL